MHNEADHTDTIAQGAKYCMRSLRKKGHNILDMLSMFETSKDVFQMFEKY